MTQSGAIARAQTLRAALLDHGVRQVSIEVVQGRPGGPNGGWWTTTFVGSMGHHIASRRTQGLTPFLSLIKTGRADLPGPIANGYGGFDEVARIICMGWANHPGSGGPWTVEAGVIPINNGRPYLFGWEFEGGIVPADWTDSYREFMGRCHAGTLAWLGRSERSHLEHKTWAPTRKVDRLSYSLAGAQTEAAKYLTRGSNDMTPEQEKFLNEMIASAKAVGTSGHFVKPTVELVRSHGGIIRQLRDEIASMAGGTVDSMARSAITALRNHLRGS